jgi:DNA polymerase-3 subunit alpha
MTGPGRGCFLPDTRVKMSNGLMKNISDIKIGDKVIDCDGNEQEVYDTLVYDVDEEIMELHFGEIVIRCTKDHKFLTKNRGWIEAQHLTSNDDIVEV